jgi:hypothetical protein
MVGKIQKGRIIGAIGHRSVSRGPLPAPVARRSLIIKTDRVHVRIGSKAEKIT